MQTHHCKSTCISGDDTLRCERPAGHPDEHRASDGTTWGASGRPHPDLDALRQRVCEAAIRWAQYEWHAIGESEGERDELLAAVEALAAAQADDGGKGG